MPQSAVEPRFTVRGVLLARAAFAAIAAVMITFSSDHSAPVGLSVFSGFAIATGLVLVLAAWLTYPTGRRGVAVLLAAAYLVAGMVAGITTLRSMTLLFVLLIAWAAVSGLIELLWGLRDRKRAEIPASEWRDAITVGALGLILAVAIALVHPDFEAVFHAPDGKDFVLTAEGIVVGLLGAYTAIVAVYQGIGGFSPRPPQAPAAADPITRVEESA